ncbi:MAG: transposase, partial [Zetaproteobacteria bacterium]
MFATHQERLPRELAAAGITTMEEANGYLAEHYMPAFNEEFAVEAEVEGSAFVAWFGGDLDNILCEKHERVVSKDNTVSF